MGEISLSSNVTNAIITDKIDFEQVVPYDTKPLEALFNDKVEISGAGSLAEDILNQEHWVDWLKNHTNDEFSPITLIGSPSLENAARFMATVSQGMYDRYQEARDRNPNHVAPTVLYGKEKSFGAARGYRMGTTLDSKGMLITSSFLEAVSSWPQDMKRIPFLDSSYTAHETGYLSGREESYHSIFFQMHPGYSSHLLDPVFTPIDQYDAQEHELISPEDRIAYVEKHPEKFKEPVLQSLKQRYENAEKYREAPDPLAELPMPLA